MNFRNKKYETQIVSLQKQVEHLKDEVDGLRYRSYIYDTNHYVSIFSRDDHKIYFDRFATLLLSYLGLELHKYPEELKLEPKKDEDNAGTA